MKLRKFVRKTNEELKMDEMKYRLEVCKRNLEDELRQADPSKIYIDDLQSSIKMFEKQIDWHNRGGSIISGAKV